ncbi:MAG: hypothetical protein ICV64_00150 [Thermoleophilia bacterium]|nr:hypothetical protein [Thermoleophilia bacterium]
MKGDAVRIGFLGIVYLVIGLVVAANRGYLEDLDRVRAVLSALLAIVLWPLLLLGFDLHVRG